MQQGALQQYPSGHHAYKVHFDGCNTDAVYHGENKRAYYHNYFKGRDTAGWKGHVNLYCKIVREQLYQGIDLAVYSREYRLKYDFLVSPGADPGQIKLRYEGVQPEITQEGNLRIRTSVNEIVEQAPYCYQEVNGKKRVVPAAYRLVQNVLSFVFPQGYDTKLPLVIDPELVYATYSGAVIPAGTALYMPMRAHATTYDASGRLYAACTSREPGWPVTTGAFGQNYNDFDDVVINVYEANGASLAYATYYGGEMQEMPLTMIVNNAGELILAGTTNSEDELPITPGCYDATFAGPLPVGLNPNPVGDLFVAHFNSGGTTLLGATYLGGTGHEPVSSQNDMNTMNPGMLSSGATMCPLELSVDPQGNIWLIGNTSSTDFPVTANAQQPVFAGGATDIILCKLSPDCSQLLYSSFLGGTGADIGYGLRRAANGTLVICGGTQSSNFPVTPGAMMTTAPGGGFDGFAAIINPATGAVIRSTYMGTAGKDQTTMLCLDAAGNIYTAGVTQGNYPISPGVFSMPQGKIFLHKLSADLSTGLVSTRLGNTDILQHYPVAMTFTECNQVLISAFGFPVNMGPGSQNDMPVTPNAMASGKRRFWFGTLDEDFSTLSYASYFGSDLSTTPAGLLLSDALYTGVHRYDPRGLLYQSLTTSNAGFPATAGSWAPNSFLVGMPPMSGQFDAGSFKISFGTSSDFSLDPAFNTNDTGCAPFTVQFVNNSSGASTFTWDFGDGSPQSNLATPPPHTYNNPGTYTITLTVTNDSTCPKQDIAYMDITVLTVEQPLISVQDTLLCSPLSAMSISVAIANPNPAFDIAWSPANGIIGPANQQTVTVNPTISSSYYVTVTDDAFGFCSLSATDTLNIQVASAGVTILTPDTVVCQGSTVHIDAIGNPAYNYTWIPGTGMNDSTILEPAILVNQSENYVLKASHPGCPDTFLLFSIGMEITPVVDLGPDKIACQWDNVALEVLINPFNSSYQYQWTPATGLNITGTPNTWLIADTTISYTLSVQTPFGCEDKDTIMLTVIPGNFGGISVDTGYCPGDSAQLLATGGVSYSWTPSYGLSDSLVSNPIATPQTSADYTVYITNAHGCVDTERVSVRVYPNAILEMPDTIVVYPGEQYRLEPGTNCLYFSWFPPSGISSTTVSDPGFDPQVNTRYFVTATTEHGCTIRDSIDVLVKETVMDMPNAFVPSGHNRLFKPAIRGIAQLNEFSIYNRWGNKIYSSNNINEGWDGTYKGSAQPVGVYIYFIDAVLDNGRSLQQKGNVTLIR